MRISLSTGVPAHSRVSTKIQQLLNTLKRPKRPPLSEFFLDDSEEIVESMKLFLMPFYWDIYFIIYGKAFILLLNIFVTNYNSNLSEKKKKINLKINKFQNVFE